MEYNMRFHEAGTKNMRKDCQEEMFQQLFVMIPISPWDHSTLSRSGVTIIIYGDISP